MENTFEKGLSQEDLKKMDEKDREKYIHFRATKTIRIIAGYQQEDFDNLPSAITFMLKKVKITSNASIHVRCPLLIKEEECRQIISSV